MNTHYRKLAVALSINAVLMLLIGYSMIERIEHLRFNLNAVHMMLMMVAPMGVVMLLVMRSMFRNTRLNAGLHAGFVLIFVAALVLVRTQTPIGNGQFLRSMIPHHSSAIVMCEQASITDPEIVAMCEEIVRTQREEIAQMQAILARQ